MNLALFDFDGTITFKDSFVPFLYHGIHPSRVAVGAVLLFPFILGHKLRILSSSNIRARLSAFGFRGKQEAEIRQLGKQYAQEVIPGTVRSNALKRIKWHKARGDLVVVVSAALNVYLDPWCREMNVDVICTELESKGGILTGRYRNGDCTGPEKASRVREKYRLDDYDTVYAYGDTMEDHEMLKLADRKYFRWEEVDTVSEEALRADRVDIDLNR